MDYEKLKTHVKLCKKNLKDKRTKLCANCPFSEEIIRWHPETKELFKAKWTAVLGKEKLKMKKEKTK